MKNKFKEETELQRFRKNMKGLTFEQKIDHIFTYYWGTLLVMIIVPVVLGLILYNIFKPNPDLVFSGICCNVTLDGEGQSYLINDWNDRLNMEPGTLELNLSYATTAGTSALDVDGGVRVVAAIAANSLDYVFCDEVAMEFLTVQQGYLPVDQILDEETLSQYSDLIYYSDADEEGTVYAAGIDVSEMPFFRDRVPEDGPIYFFFANKEGADLELLRQFWSHLEAWEAE